MHESNHGAEQHLEFSVPNVGGGPANYTTADLESASGVALAVLLRGHYCTMSRQQARELSDHVDAFEQASVPVVAVLPNSAERAELWQRRYDLSVPLLADPAEPDDPDSRAFDAFAPIADLIPRRPGLAVLDTDGETPTVAEIHSGPRLQDCPDAEAMLEIATEGAHEPTATASSAAD